MDIGKGIAVSPGIAIERASVIKTKHPDIGSRYVEDQAVPHEVERVRQAISRVTEQFVEIDQKAAERFGRDVIGEMFRAQIEMLEDEAFFGRIEHLIRQERLCAEHAVSRCLRRYMKSLNDIGDDYMASRCQEIHTAENRLLAHLLGQERDEETSGISRTILVGSRITPREVVMLDATEVVGFAAGSGDRTSHAGIVARALGIPAVVALEDFSAKVSSGDMVIVDGNRGIAIVNPDVATIRQYKEYADEYESLRREMTTSRAKLRIFMCYSSQDREVVLKLHHRLCRDNFKPWIDQEQVLGGHPWQLQIMKALKDAHVVIVCLSQNSVNKKGFVQREIGQALDIAQEQPEGSIFLIPVRLDPCVVPQRLSHLHFIDLFEKDGYRRLLTVLRLRSKDCE